MAERIKKKSDTWAAIQAAQDKGWQFASRHNFNRWDGRYYNPDERDGENYIDAETGDLGFRDGADFYPMDRSDQLMSMYTDLWLKAHENEASFRDWELKFLLWFRYHFVEVGWSITIGQAKLVEKIWTWKVGNPQKWDRAKRGAW